MPSGDRRTARSGASPVYHRLPGPSEGWRLVDPGGHDAIQGRRQHRVADHRPAAPYLRQGGITAGRGVGTLNCEDVSGGGHAATALNAAATASGACRIALRYDVVASGGSLRPCSQSRWQVKGMPKRAQNPACVRPVTALARFARAIGCIRESNSSVIAMIDPPLVVSYFLILFCFAKRYIAEPFIGIGIR